MRDFRRLDIAAFVWAFEGQRQCRLGAAAISFMASGRIVVELVGPGYDNANLTKGITNIPVRAMTKQFAPSWSELARGTAELRPLDIEIWDEARALAPNELSQVREQRLNGRLEWLARQEKVSVPELVRRYKSAGQTFLFDRQISYDFGRIKKLFDLALKYARFKEEHGFQWNEDSLGIQITPSGRFVLDGVWDAKSR
jgi:hypothetical protein